MGRMGRMGRIGWDRMGWDGMGRKDGWMRRPPRPPPPARLDRLLPLNSRQSHILFPSRGTRQPPKPSLDPHPSRYNLSKSIPAPPCHMSHAAAGCLDYGSTLYLHRHRRNHGESGGPSILTCPTPRTVPSSLYAVTSTSMRESIVAWPSPPTTSSVVSSATQLRTSGVRKACQNGNSHVGL